MQFSYYSQNGCDNSATWRPLTPGIMGFTFTQPSREKYALQKCSHMASDIRSNNSSFLDTSVWDLRLLKEFTVPEMGVDGGGSREKGVRHLARVFKSPISLLHKDQLSSSREGMKEGGRAPLLVCSHFVPPLFSKERECTVDS